jgi:LPXTG-motif cell wall-anchored protein
MQNTSAKPANSPVPSASKSRVLSPHPVEKLSSRTVVTVNAQYCDDLEQRLRKLDDVTCKDLALDLQNEFGCGDSKNVVAVASPTESPTQEKKKDSISPMLIGAGLLGFLLGYMVKKRKKVTQLVPNPIPVPVPVPVPGAPYTPPVRRGVN